MVGVANVAANIVVMLQMKSVRMYKYSAQLHIIVGHCYVNAMLFLLLFVAFCNVVLTSLSQNVHAPRPTVSCIYIVGVLQLLPWSLDKKYNES